MVNFIFSAVFTHSVPREFSWIEYYKLVTVDSLHLSYPLSQISTCLEQKPCFLRHLCGPHASFSLFFLNALYLEYLPVSNKYLGSLQVFSLYLELFLLGFFYTTKYN